MLIQRSPGASTISARASSRSGGAGADCARERALRRPILGLGRLGIARTERIVGRRHGVLSLGEKTVSTPSQRARVGTSMLERSPSEPSPGRITGDHEVPREGPAMPGSASQPIASRAAVATLQRQVGNRATMALLQRWGLSDLRVPLLGPIVGGVSGLVGSLWVWRPWFLRRAWDLRQRPIFSAEWDAWGHCVTAAMTASWGS